MIGYLSVPVALFIGASFVRPVGEKGVAMNDQQEYVLSKLRDELDAKDRTIDSLRKKSKADDGVALFAIATIIQSATHVSVSFTIGVAIGWWLL